jgi:DNA-directed RNA polymerase subunit RPC12/RpoP
MKYKCPDCGKSFMHTAKQILPGMTITEPVLEVCVCPFCQSKEFDELTENPQETGNVYVYDLTSGAQTKLDELLSQGYKVAARYSKQYILEKTKEVKA